MSRTAGRSPRGPAAWVWIVFGALAFLVGVGMTLQLPVVLAERDAYRQARPCAGAETEDCVRETSAVVRDTYVRGYRRGDRHTVVLVVEGDTDPTFVRLPDPDLVFEHLDDGREVTVRLWDDRVASVDVPGVGRAETDDSPAMAAADRPGIGLFLLSFGGFGVWHGLAGRRGVDHAATKPGPRGAIGRVLIALGAGSIVGGLQVLWLDVYAAWAYYATTAVTAALVWLALRRRVTPG